MGVLIMKKIILIALMFLPMTSFILELNATPISVVASSGRSVVFRSTQKLRSNDGREIYLFSSRKCELWDEGRLVAECTYTIRDGELLLIADGKVLYKGRIYMDGINCKKIVLSGTTYYRRN